VNDVESLKISEKSKFRAIMPEGFGQGNRQTGGNSDYENTRINIQMESLFEKISVNGEKIFKLEIDMAEIKEQTDKASPGKHISNLIEARFGELEMEVLGIKKDISKKQNE
jgi:hypothetical protein